MLDFSRHPIALAARAAGFIEAKPATAYPFNLWKEKLAALPLGQYLEMDHRPETQCGWPVAETTLWAATFPAPPLSEWPEGYGEVSSYYLRERDADASCRAWAQAVRALGYEVVAGPDLPDRAVAMRAGLGVHGLFGPMITPTHGSFVVIATLLVHAAPPEGAPGPENDPSPGCARCGKCRSACPTGAIGEHGVDALQCLRNDMGHPEFMPESHYALMGRRIHGCDTCQRACPSNRAVPCVAPTPEQIAPFKLEALLAEPDLRAIGARIDPAYARKERMQRQAALAAANTGRRDLLPRIRPLAESEDEPLRKAARWAIEQLEGS
jgi:epoxyqueuosine reductase